MREFCCLYVTFPSAAEAALHAEALIEQELIACANIIPSTLSLYKWEGALERSEEAILLGKTTNCQQRPIEHYLAEKHPYECPCILFYPIYAGFPPYLRWIQDNVREDKKSA